jgi:hypothetical protein
MLHRQPVDGWDRHQKVDPLISNRGDEPLNGELGQDDRRPTHLDRGDELAVAAGHMKQRHGDQVPDIGARSTGLPLERFRCRKEVFV